MKVLIIVGSAARNSHSLHIGQAVEKSLKNKNAETTLVDLIELGLPTFQRTIDLSKEYDQKTADFLKLGKEADAHVWITPVYHNSYSSTMKNALDWLHFFMDGKVVGLASNGGNRAPVAIDQLMLVARSQHMIISPSRVCTQEDDYDENLNIISPQINKRIEAFADELIMLTAKMSAKNND